jgi:hypothetical protein
MRLKVCQNCGRAQEAAKIVRRLCPACYQFERRTGRPRTPDVRRHPPRPCVNCKLTRGWGRHGLCRACYQWRQDHGTKRPRDQWATECVVCGMPKKPGFTRGRCATCYNYRRRVGRDRPPERVRALYPLGWCECGLPAATVLTLSVSHSSDAFPLCKECAQLEQAS